MGVSGVAWVAVPFAVLWTFVGGWLGYRQKAVLSEIKDTEN